MMPFVPDADDLARWLAPQTGKSISLASTPWQPNDRMIGLVAADSLLKAPSGAFSRLSSCLPRGMTPWNPHSQGASPLDTPSPALRARLIPCDPSFQRLAGDGGRGPAG